MAYMTPKGVLDLMASLARSAKRRQKPELAKKIESATKQIEKWADWAIRLQLALQAREVQGVFSLNTEITQKLQMKMGEAFPEPQTWWARAENRPNGIIVIVAGAYTSECREHTTQFQFDHAKFDMISIIVNTLRKELAIKHLMPPAEMSLGEAPWPFEGLPR